jgi:phage/plasmid-like protein (TIGR03299 family)
MAHQLCYNEQTGTYSFFTVHQKAWHGLGQRVDQYPTSAEALQYAGLDFQVVKRKLFTYDNQNSFGNCDHLTPILEVPQHYATLRTDTEAVLGVVGRDYQVIQNRDAFSFFDAIVGGDGIQYETAGALGRGERIFITAKLPGYIRVGREDLIEQYLFLTTSHNGYGAITAAFTPVRIVCNNTLNAALKNCSNAIRIRHTTGAKERLEQAHKVMGLSSKLSSQLEDIFNTWSKVPIKDGALKHLIQLAMAPNKEVLHRLQVGEDNELSACFRRCCESAFDYAMSHDSQQLQTTKGTLFGAYNAVTGYFQNVRVYKNKEAKLNALLYGGTAQLRTQKAFQLCEAFAAKSDSFFN